MKLLLDTHVFIWWDSEPAKLSKKALALCNDPGNTLLLSVASAWEMQIKMQLGKMKLDFPLQDIISEQRRDNGLHVIPVELEHVLALQSLPAHHKDPFDRLLIAQARSENAVLVSKDKAFSKYQIDLVW
ncbi:MAG: type II toxin-antitoxin system VapC family toxin [Deltaproteobacteria bacterium]|nr:type II toxin-antitoxin system VapC family toxin [Deltaproteobacteria bacterium]